MAASAAEAEDGGDDDDALNETPENLLTVVEEGLWTLTPPGGPYTALTGYLNITELQDGALPDPEPPEDDEDGEPVDVSCQLVYAMTGLPAAESCIGCDSAWTVDIYLDDGNPENCYGPERPEDGESRTYAYSQSDLALYLDFQDMGTWLYWYSALQNGDYISFDWTTEIGFTPEEDD